MKRIALFLLAIYKHGISPLFCNQAACRFQPTCSEYMKQAIEKYGFWKGFRLGIKRLSRCHPKGGYGYDPVP